MVSQREQDTGAVPKREDSSLVKTPAPEAGLGANPASASYQLSLKFLDPSGPQSSHLENGSVK